MSPLTLQQQAEKVLGAPRPAGDPAAMLRAAIALEEVATKLRGQRDELQKTHIEGKGNAIVRNNRRVETRRLLLLHRAQELEGVASKVRLRAGSIKGNQDNWDAEAKRRVPGFR